MTIVYTNVRIKTLQFTGLHKVYFSVLYKTHKYKYKGKTYEHQSQIIITQSDKCFKDKMIYERTDCEPCPAILIRDE